MYRKSKQINSILHLVNAIKYSLVLNKNDKNHNFFFHEIIMKEAFAYFVHQILEV